MTKSHGQEGMTGPITGYPEDFSTATFATEMHDTEPDYMSHDDPAHPYHSIHAETERQIAAGEISEPFSKVEQVDDFSTATFATEMHDTEPDYMSHDDPAHPYHSIHAETERQIAAGEISEPFSKVEQVDDFSTATFATEMHDTEPDYMSHDDPAHPYHSIHAETERQIAAGEISEPFSHSQPPTVQ